VADERTQAAVRGRVAHEHATQEGRGVVAEDELLVQALHGVGVDDLEAVGRRPEGVAEAGDVDPEQLELRRQVGVGERGLAAEQTVGHHLRHRVARPDQPPDPVGHAGDLADGVDGGVARAAPLVGEHPAARVHRQPGAAGELVARTDTRGEHDDVDVERVAGRELHPLHPAGVVGDHARRRGRRPDRHAEALDQPAQRLAAACVDLDRHEPVGELDHGGLGAERGEGAGGLQAQEPAADDRAADGAAQRGLALGHPGAQGVEVVDRPVDEAAAQVGALHRRHGRVRAGGQDERVVAPLLPADDDRARRRVDRLDRRARVQRDPRGVPQRRVAEQQLLGSGEVEVAGQRHPVVRGVHLLAVDLHVPPRGRVALHEGFDETTGDHAGSGHDQGAAFHVDDARQPVCRVPTPPVTGLQHLAHAPQPPAVRSPGRPGRPPAASRRGRTRGCGSRRIPWSRACSRPPPRPCSSRRPRRRRRRPS
jgi:hypothetical protein